MAYENVIGLDTETNGIRFDGAVSSIQIYHPESQQGEFLALDMRDLPPEKAKENLQRARDLVANRPLVVFNGSFDLLQLRKVFPEIRPTVAGDGYLLACLTQQEKASLSFLASKLGVNTNPMNLKELDFASEVGYDTTKIPYDHPTFIKYGLDDARDSYFVEQKLKATFGAFLDVYRLELDCLNAFTDMAYYGMHLDWPGFLKFREEYALTEGQILDRVKQIAGSDFKPRSVVQVRKLLFDKLQLPVPPHRTGKGDVSTSREALKWMSEHTEHTVVKDLLEYSKVGTRLKTLRNLEDHIPMVEQDGAKVLHPFYRQVGFDGTSRVYTQNPSTNSLPLEIRDFIVPSAPGRKFIYWDWKAAEFMMAAYWAGEKWAVQVYESGGDPYRALAEKMYSVDPTTISDEQRKVAKVVSLMCLYGSEGGSASQVLGVELSEAVKLVERFWTVCPEIARLRQQLVRDAHRSGVAITITGRRRRLPDLASPVAKEREKAERQVFNTAIQGSVADAQKYLVRSFWKDFGGKSTHLTTTVYDSFLMETSQAASPSNVRAYIDKLSEFDIRGIKFKLQCVVGEGQTYKEAMDSAE